MKQLLYPCLNFKLINDILYRLRTFETPNAIETTKLDFFLFCIEQLSRVMICLGVGKTCGPQ